MARWGSFCIRWGSLGAHGGSRWAGSPPKLPYIGDPDVEYPYVVFPYIEIPYLDISSIEIPYIEIPYVEIPYIDIPCVDFPYPHLTHKAKPKAKAKAKPKPKPKPKAKQKATPTAKAKAKAKGLIVVSANCFSAIVYSFVPLHWRPGKASLQYYKMLQIESICMAGNQENGNRPKKGDPNPAPPGAPS